jgi:hypothetical protein
MNPVFVGPAGRPSLTFLELKFLVKVVSASGVISMDKLTFDLNGD